MKRPIIVKTGMDAAIEELAGRTGHRTLGTWAADCAERVLPHFEGRSPGDSHPRDAIAALRVWVQTGVFRMADVRRVSLAAHAAARSVSEDDPARSSARSAGQAVATAHVPRHALAAARYAATAIRDPTALPDADAAAFREREWQYQHLRDLGEDTRA